MRPSISHKELFLDYTDLDHLENEATLIHHDSLRWQHWNHLSLFLCFQRKDVSRKIMWPKVISLMLSNYCGPQTNSVAQTNSVGLWLQLFIQQSYEPDYEHTDVSMVSSAQPVIASKLR